MPLLLVLLIILILFGSKLLPRLGSELGKKARKPYRQARWMWSLLGGTEEESIRAEREYGRECAREFVKQFEGESSFADRDFVNEIGSRLAAAVGDTRLEFSFAVLASGTTNAYALPGGFVFITRSLLGLSNRDRDTVAFFLGHEISHVARGHAKEHLATGALLNAVSARLAGAGALLREVAGKGYSRDLEREADREAVRLMKAAGFDPHAAVLALERLSRSAPANPGLAEYFSSHPSFAERIRNLETVI